MPQAPDDVSTRVLDPNDIIQANRGAWRRAITESICESARIMAAKDTTTAERVRLAQLIEILVRALDVV